MLKYHEFESWVGIAFPNTAPDVRQRLLDKAIVGVAPKDAEPSAIIAAETLFSHMGLTQPAPIAPPPAPQFSLGQQSRGRLIKLFPKLRQCVERAIEITECDFTVLETSRTLQQQQQNVAKGVSRTLKSKHIPGADGFAHAVDLAAWVNGKIDWNHEVNYCAIAYAMDRAATEFGVADHVRWGAAWDRVLSDFGGSPTAYMNEATAYAKRHAGSDLIDMPHFEWVD
jgi:peptidoglycan L-alanyl-D-glutamate endopeptidase CwlK